MKKSILLCSLFCAIVLFTSCNNDDDVNPIIIDFGTAPSSSILTTGTVDVITENTIRYHFLTLGGLSSTIVESETGIVVIDLGAPFFVPNTGEELRTYSNTIGKPISVIITHDHVDHYANINKFIDVPVYAETNSAAALMGDSGFTDVYTNTITAVSSTQIIQGIEFTFDNVSNAETGENGYVYITETKALFTGDLVFNQAHNYLREYTPLDATDELNNWIDGLNSLKSNYGNYNHIFAGHGGKRTDVSTVIDENIAYLTDAQGLIKGTKNLTSGGIATTNQEVVDELTLLYSNYATGALNLSLPGAFFPGDLGATWF